ncbi:MAG: hypothetical protein GXO16_07050 [Epsilonproteobacteria bacterium]|nr:hypothetical protein [Campylobacterota bacterium]
MHEYEALYQRYRRYRLKKALKRWGAITAVAVVGLGAAGYYYLTAMSKDLEQPTAKAPQPAPKQEATKQTPKPKTEAAKKAEPNVSTAVKYDPKKNKIEPYFGFEKRLVPPPPKPLRLDESELMKKEVPKTAQQTKSTQPKEAAQQKEITAQTAPRKEPRLLIKSQQSDDLKAIEAKFYADPTVGRALVIANMYYAKGDYENAAKWALRANSIDKKNEESWLLFAKSLAKKGDRQKAVSVLEIYAKQSGSKEALELARKIRSGVFR